MSVTPAFKRAGLGTEEALGCERMIFLARGVGFEELREEQRSLSGNQSESLPSQGCLSP